LKHSNKKLSLRAYLSLSFLIFSAVLIIIMWLFQTVFFDGFYSAIKTVQAKNCAQSVAHNIDDDDLDSMLKEIEEQNNMDVSIYDATTGMLTPLYTPHEFLSTHSLINMSSVYQLYQACLENGGVVTQKSQNQQNALLFNNHDFAPPLEKQQSELLSCAIITEAYSSQYLVIVESDISPVTSTVETLKVQLYIITLIMIVISIFIAVVTAHYLSKPMNETNKKAKQLANQNYDLAFYGGNYRELCELNDTLTYSAQELKKVDELRRELIANISHDLRTPLTMITGYSEVMRDIPGENSPQNIQIVIDEANRLSQLVNDLLDISKLESGTATINNSVFCLTDCIKDIFKRYTKLIEQDGYVIEFEHDCDVYINADSLRISQVMYNLINNAINYSGEDKTVIVRQTVQNYRVKVEVIDHGVGIEEDKLPYIWDRYYKVDKEHKRALVVTGLGLSIVKNILNQYDSHYGVISKTGVGSDFWFLLPICTPVINDFDV